ncbi:MAG: transcription-repair coupling factor, partial [Verrucomicrobia bacterium]
QSGHIVAVGFDLYCQLLKQAVGQIKGQKPRRRLEVELRLDFVATNEAEFVHGDARVSAFLPRSYINDTPLRIQAYRRIAEITTAEQLDRLIKEWRDRFGAFPKAVENLITLAQIKLAAAIPEISRVETREDKLMLTRRGDFILVGGKFPRLFAPEIEKRLQEILGLLRKL